jgi:hypothetical protein
MVLGDLLKDLSKMQSAQVFSLKDAVFLKPKPVVRLKPVFFVLRSSAFRFLSRFPLPLGQFYIVCIFYIMLGFHGGLNLGAVLPCAYRGFDTFIPIMSY